MLQQTTFRRVCSWWGWVKTQLNIHQTDRKRAGTHTHTHVHVHIHIHRRRKHTRDILNTLKHWIHTARKFIQRRNEYTQRRDGTRTQAEHTQTRGTHKGDMVYMLRTSNPHHGHMRVWNGQAKHHIPKISAISPWNPRKCETIARSLIIWQYN